MNFLSLKQYVVLPLRDVVIFPNMVAPLFVGREKSIRALDEAVQDNKDILLITQKDATNENPSPDDFYPVGVIASIMQLLKLPDGTVKVLVESHKRVKVKKFIESKRLLEAQVEAFDIEEGDTLEIEALTRSIIAQFESYVKLNKKVTPEMIASLEQIKDPEKFSDVVSSHLSLKIPQKQEILEIANIKDRLEKIFSCIEAEIGILNTEQKIRSRVKGQMEKSQKDYYLNEQMKAIQKELGENDDTKNEIKEFENRIKNTKLTEEAKEKANAELQKLRMMSPMSAESSVVRNYLDWLLSIPWFKPTKVRSNIKAAQKILDQDHYGLEKVKERILEYLAVQQRTKKVKGSILCLVGPPGVGKTSLAKSIAEATGRNFVRMSLGGVRDESEIRGHRRTYIGSMPGKIIQSMKKAKSSNPLFLIDEIDKIGQDHRGDPASALLEVLDQEQNEHFNDHYLEVDYDLSDVMFVATANTTNLPLPLLDRLEIIRLSGYTEDEKVQIAKRHLVSKQKELNGLRKPEWSISDEAIRDIIRYYTREAGVRNLEREIANLTRKAIKEIMMKTRKKIGITCRNLAKYAGVRRYDFGQTESENLVGVTTGLAYTETGGDLLVIEAVTVPGKGKVKITGKLGEVMQESVQAAISYVRSRATDFGITPPEFQNQDLHIHVPEGATPKDGPSAGIAMCTTIVSIMTGIPVRKTVAMTGEVTLRGRVLAIGGLKEKLLAALRGGVKTVLIPEDNQKDLAELPANIKKGLEIIPVSTVDEVLKTALVKTPEPIEWSEMSPIQMVGSSENNEDMLTN